MAKSGKNIATLYFVKFIFIERKWTDVQDLKLNKKGESVLIRGRLHTSRGTG